MPHTTYMPGASKSWMLPRPWPSRDHAGNPRARRPGRSGFEAWEAQLHRWGISPSSIEDGDETMRLWKITTDRGGKKKTRTIRGPTSLRDRYGIRGWRINAFADNIATKMKRTIDGIQEGPYFMLTFNDARRLWADRDFVVVPACDEIEVRNIDAA